MSIFGLLVLNKPSGVTSRRVVDQVQRLVRPAKVGHAGTLDPLASGVLVVGIGQATRLFEYLQELPKHYRATFLLGRSSPTEDIESEVTELAGAPVPTIGEIERAAASLRGEIEQRPPAYSALKVSGRRAYDLAREGETPELSPRGVRIDRLMITRYAYPELDVEVVCSSGTYVRSLGRDLAEAAGSAAVMSALERTAIGPFLLAEAVDPALLTRENLAEHLRHPILAVRGLMQEVAMSDRDVERIGRGLPVAVADVAGDRCAAVDSAGRLRAILIRHAGEQFRPAKNFLLEG